MIIRKSFTGLILLLLLYSGCEKSEIVQLDLKGTIKGKIYTLDEFGNRNNDNENVSFKLSGSEPLISVLTDSVGKYELSDIPSGTYDLIISKEGYGEYQRQGFQVVGGDEPLYFNISITEKSNTKIENLSLEIVNNSEIYLSGVVNHNYVIDGGWTFSSPVIRYFIHKLDNPSENNYLQTGTLIFNGESGSQLYSQINIDKKLFSSGSKMYIITYGCYRYENGYYDILSNQYKYSSLGTASNIPSIVIP